MKINKQYKEVKETIVKYGLKPTSQRDICPFGLSCLIMGYTILLRKQMGFSYEAIGVLGSSKGCHAIFNEKHIADSMEKYLGKNFDNLDNCFFKPAKEIHLRVRDKLTQLDKNKNSKEVLSELIQIYPECYKLLSMYNCFWRYLGNESSKGKISSDLVNKIASERNEAAKLYVETENIIKKCVKDVGEKEGFDGDLLRYFTRVEMINYLKVKKLTQVILEELENRRKGYFLFFIEKENKEFIFSDKKFIDSIYKEFYEVNTENITEIKGFPAFGGKIKGFVYNLQIGGKEPLKDFILVASSTHPDQINLIKRSSGIITDEGGILSHAAIIARELNKPCIIGTKIATKVLKDGDIVEMDANNGIVKIIK